MLKINYNPCTQRRQFWINQLPQKAQDRLKEITEGVWCVPKLIKLKKNRQPVEVKVGDIFLVSNREGLYFYGKVLQKTDPKCKPNQWIDNTYVAVIFNCTTQDKTLDNFSPNYKSFTAYPRLYEVGFWKKGYFEIIGNIPLTKEEKNMDIGFFDGNSKEGGVFINLEGKIMSHIPQYFSPFAWRTIMGVELSLEEMLIEKTTSV